MAIAHVADLAFLSTKTSGTSLTGPTCTVSPGDTIFLWIVMDNLTLSTPTVSSIAKPAGEANNWARITQYSAHASTAAGSTRGELWAITTSVVWTAQVATITLSASVAAKGVVGKVFSGVGSVLSSSSASAAAGTGASLSPGTTGALFLRAGGWEQATVPSPAFTGTGSYGNQVSGATTGGSANTNVAVALEHATSAPSGSHAVSSAADNGISVAAFPAAPDPPVGPSYMDSQIAGGLFSTQGTSGGSNLWYKDLSLGTVAVGDVIFVAGVGENYSASTPTIATQGGGATTGAWTTQVPPLTAEGSTGYVAGYAVVTAAGTLTVRVTLGYGANIRMGVCAWRFPVAQVNAGYGFLSSGIANDADGRESLTIPASGGVVLQVLGDWTATSMGTSATPAGGTNRRNYSDSTNYAVWAHEWLGQTAGTRDYGLPSASGRDIAASTFIMPGASSLNPASGTVPAVSTVALDGTARVIGSGSAVAVSTVAAAVTSRQNVAGTVPSTSGVQGAATVRTPGAGTIPATSSTSLTVGRLAPVDGTVAAVSAAALDVTVRPSAAGEIAAQSTAALAVTSRSAASGVAVASSAASLTATVRRAVDATVAAVSAVQGDVTARRNADGVLSAVSDSSLAATIRTPASGTVAAVSTASLSSTDQSSGTVVATSSASLAVTVRRSVTSVTPVTSAASVDVTTRQQISGTVAASSAAQLLGTGRMPASGQVAAVSSAAASVTSRQNVAGQVAAQSGASLTAGSTNPASGTVAATSTVSLTVGVRRAVQGTVVAVSTVAGQATLTRAVAGEADGSSGSSLTVTVTRAAEGVVDVVSDAQLDARTVYTVEGLAAAYAETSLDAGTVQAVAGTVVTTSGVSLELRVLPPFPRVTRTVAVQPTYPLFPRVEQAVEPVRGRLVLRPVVDSDSWALPTD